jgi:hypothetical protein
MKTILHLEVEDICEAVWDKITGDIKPGYRMEFSEPNFNFTYDDNGGVTGIDVDTITYKGEEE